MLPSLVAQDELLNPRLCPPGIVDVKVSADVTTKVGERHADDLPADGNNCDFEFTLGLDEVE